MSRADALDTAEHARRATDEPVTRIEKCQIDTNQGPCQDAFESCAVIVAPDLQAESRWPDYRAGALQSGARAVAGIPLVVRGEPIGALNLYWSQPHEPTDAELSAADLLAAMAAGYVANMTVISDTERMNRQLQAALESSVVMEQAKGAIAERHSVTPDEALALLHHHARTTRREIHDVAADVVARQVEL